MGYNVIGVYRWILTKFWLSQNESATHSQRRGLIDFSKLFSPRMITIICPKYDSCCFFINAFRGFVALISSITDLLVLLAVRGIRSNLLQHHNSKLSILHFSCRPRFTTMPHYCENQGIYYSAFRCSLVVIFVFR